jgi:hypothetical protein
MKRINFVKQHEAQRLANQGLSRWVLPWSEPGGRYRALYNEVRLALVAELQRIARIPARYRREADREILALVFRLLNGTPPPSKPDTVRASRKRHRRSPKLVLISSRDRPKRSPVAPTGRRVPVPPRVGNVSRLPAESKAAATTRRAANAAALARKARTRATRERHG